MLHIRERRGQKELQKCGLAIFTVNFGRKNYIQFFLSVDRTSYTGLN